MRLQADDGWRRFGWVYLLSGLLALYWTLPVVALAQEALCAEVKIVIEQKLSLERQAFDAHMVISNGLESDALNNIRVTLTFTDAQGQAVVATTDPNATGAPFFVRVDRLSGVGTLDGTGRIEPKSVGDIHWLIIPAAGTGGTSGTGRLYYVGATLEYTLNGQTATVKVTPDYVVVRPQPLLQLDYFLPTDVYADDPFTPAIEPAVPFSLGVRIKNVGGGRSAKTQILSAQPRIVENRQGLLIDFQIVGSYIDNQPAGKSLLLDFGDINPGQARMGRWLMVTTLSGRFVEFTAEYQHADSLGGAVTSLLETIATHTLVHDVKVDLPGRDAVNDFLARDVDTLRIYESESIDTLVADQSINARLESTSNGTTLTLPATVGFAYGRVPDPFRGTRPLGTVIRSDGKVMPIENAWLSKSQNLDHSWSYFINIFDAATPGRYQLSFATGTQSSLAGVVYNDLNGNGVQETTEVGLTGVSVRLQGSDETGANIALTATTDATGQYRFEALGSGRYSVAVGTVNGYTDGAAQAGTAGGIAALGVVSDIVLSAGLDAEGYRFAKRSGTVPPTQRDQADVGITLTGTPLQLKEGDSLSVVITANQHGPDTATHVAVAVNLPSMFTVTQAHASQGTYSQGVWTLGDWASGGSATLTLNLQTAKLTEPVTASATISAATVDPVSSNNIARLAFTPKEGQIHLSQQLTREIRLLLLIACPEVAANEQAACAQRKAQFAIAYLKAQGYRADAVFDATTFKTALRSGRFNTYWLSGAGEQLTAALADEVRIAVLRGDALILDGPPGTTASIFDEVTGSHLETTALGQNLPLTLSSGGAAIATDGTAWSIQLHGATALAAFSATQSALVTHTQGLGQTLVAAFDVWETLAQSASEAALRDTLHQRLEVLTPPLADVWVGGAYVPLQSTINNPLTARPLTVAMTLPAGMQWEDADPPLTVTDLVHPAWSFNLGSDQSSTLRLGLRLPTKTGTDPVETTLTETGVTPALDTYRIHIDTLSVAELFTQTRNQLNALTPTTTGDQQRRDEALAALQAAETADTHGDLEAALTALLKADHALASLTINGIEAARIALSRGVQGVELSKTTPPKPQPQVIKAVGGTPQSTLINSVFIQPLQALVQDVQGQPLTGMAVTFVVPNSGASATFAGGQTSVTATTGADGVAHSPPLTANGTVGTYSVQAQVAGVAAPALFTLTNTAVVTRHTVTIQGGNQQSAVIHTVFADPLVLRVHDHTNVGIAGAAVTFIVPDSGASALFAGGQTRITVTTDADGVAHSPPLTANGTVGTYNVRAEVAEVAEPVQFTLTNIAATTGQTFSGVTATGTGTMTARMSGGGPNCAFDLTATHLTTVDGLPRPLGRILFPNGVFTYVLTGCVPGSTITVVTTWPNLKGLTGYLKYGPTPASNGLSIWYLPNNLHIEGATVSYTVQDGGLGDDDLKANGTVRDPGGPVVMDGVDIPTLDEVVLIGLAFALMYLGAAALRQRRQLKHRVRQR
jgi:hypothetical protein